MRLEKRCGRESFRSSGRAIAHGRVDLSCRSAQRERSRGIIRALRPPFCNALSRVRSYRAKGFPDNGSSNMHNAYRAPTRRNFRAARRARDVFPIISNLAADNKPPGNADTFAKRDFAALAAALPSPLNGNFDSIDVSRNLARSALARSEIPSQSIRIT